MTEYEMKLQEEYDRLMLEISSESLIKFRNKCIKDGLNVSRIFMPWAGMTGFKIGPWPGTEEFKLKLNK